MGPPEPEVCHPGREHASPRGGRAREARCHSAADPGAQADRRRFRGRAWLYAGAGGEERRQTVRQPGGLQAVRCRRFATASGSGWLARTAPARRRFSGWCRALEEPTGGTIRLGANIVVGYYAQEQETLDPKLSPMELVRKLKPLNEQQALSFLVGFLFDRDDTLNPIANLSGGERSRLQIATLILRGANFLLLDEPTNNLDLASIEELEEALLDFPGAILTISHDRYYLDKLCTRIIELNDGIVRDYPGGFSYYDANRDKGTELTIRPPAPPIAAPVRRR